MLITIRSRRRRGRRGRQSGGAKEEEEWDDDHNSQPQPQELQLKIFIGSLASLVLHSLPLLRFLSSSTKLCFPSFGFFHSEETLIVAE